MVARVRVVVEVVTSQPTYLGYAVDEPLPVDFTGTSYNVATLVYNPSSRKYEAVYEESRDFPDGRHFIIVSTTRNDALQDLTVKFLDSAGNVFKSWYTWGAMGNDQQFCAAFDVVGTSIEYLYDFSGQIPAGTTPFTATNPSTTSTGQTPQTPLNIFEGMDEAVKGMMSMVMNVAIMMVMVQVVMNMVMGVVAGAS